MEVDDAISSITETIKTAKKIAEVEIVPEPKQLFPDLDILIKEKKRVRKRWQRLRQARDKAELNRLTNRIHKLTRNHRANKFAAEVEDAIENKMSVWKLGSRLTSKNFDNKPIHGATGLKYEAEDKANAIGTVLKTSFEPTNLMMIIYNITEKSGDVCST